MERNTVAIHVPKPWKLIGSIMTYVIVQQYSYCTLKSNALSLAQEINGALSRKIIQGGSNMTGTDLYVNKPHCAAAVRP